MTTLRMTSFHLTMRHPNANQKKSARVNVKIAGPASMSSMMMIEEVQGSESHSGGHEITITSVVEHLLDGGHFLECRSSSPFLPQRRFDLGR